MIAISIYLRMIVQHKLPDVKKNIVGMDNTGKTLTFYLIWHALKARKKLNLNRLTLA